MVVHAGRHKAGQGRRSASNVEQVTLTPACDAAHFPRHLVHPEMRLHELEALARPEVSLAVSDFTFIGGRRILRNEAFATCWVVHHHSFRSDPHGRPLISKVSNQRATRNTRPVLAPS